MQSHLTCFVRSTAANILVWTLERLGLVAEAADILSPYDEFLRRLDSEEVRNHLGILPSQQVYRDEQFLELRDISHQFQGALDRVFFQADTELREFTRTYGVF